MNRRVAEWAGDARALLRLVPGTRHVGEPNLGDPGVIAFVVELENGSSAEILIKDAP